MNTTRIETVTRICHYALTEIISRRMASYMLAQIILK